MVQPPQNKQGNGFYLNRCACGRMVDVPVSGAVVHCPFCDQPHVWPKTKLSHGERFVQGVDGRPTHVRVVPVPNPDIG